MTAAGWVQLAYPDEPDWHALADAVLVELVEQHVAEQSCAEGALTELARRRHSMLNFLCDAMLNSPFADKWLQAQALSLLLSHCPLQSFDRCLGLVDDYAVELLGFASLPVLRPTQPATVRR